MFPHDPIRQKMLFKTEWRVRGATGNDAYDIERSLNSAIAALSEEGFNITQIMPAPPAKDCPGGMIVVGQRVSSPVNDPTPQGAPIPGTSAQQTVEITYSFIENGVLDKKTCKSLQEAVRTAVADLETSSRPGLNRQPISIHVTSVTQYTPGDLHVLRDKLG